jgi:hypothetical protein
MRKNVLSSSNWQVARERDEGIGRLIRNELRVEVKVSRKDSRITKRLWSSKMKADRQRGARAAAASEERRRLTVANMAPIATSQI